MAVPQLGSFASGAQDVVYRDEDYRGNLKAHTGKLRSKVKTYPFTNFSIKYLFLTFPVNEIRFSVQMRTLCRKRCVPSQLDS
jgi:hypothetical protein